ncbi:MAG TPA: tetratricopeptide repeat protein [Tepidisphaeraceae bacterium]|jgi:tetratricopeptide (TPR) repeat protein
MRINTVLAVATLTTALVLAGCASPGQKSPAEQAKAEAQKQWAGARANVLGGMAKEQYDSGNFDKCRETLGQALKMDPENAPLRVLSARLAIEQSNLELADQELIVARRLDPKNAEADYLSGVVCQRWQRPQEAYDYYRSASEKQPAELAYLMAQAEMLVNLNRADDALALLQAKVVFFEYSGAIRDAVGQILMQKGKYSEAVDILHQASILATDDITIREHLALAYLRNKQYREAADTLGRLVKDDRYAKRADLYLALGECQLNLNKARDARDSFQTASQLNPNQASAWLALGKVALQLNDPGRAEMSLKRSLTIDPASSEANLLLGYARLRQKKLDEALACFRKASALDTNDTVSICMIGYVLEKQGKSTQALQFYAQALKIKPGDEMATRLMAQVQIDQ